MTNVSSHTDDTTIRRGIGAASAFARLGLRSVEAVTFWAAVLLPFAYLPLLVGGLNDGELLVFAALVAANALALVVGHDYAAE
jgi:hypothetical protein